MLIVWTLDAGAVSSAAMDEVAGCAEEGAQAAATTVVDVVDRPATPEAFPGLYLGALPEAPFLGKPQI